MASVTGVVSALGNSYKDGVRRVEIWVDREKAGVLPYKDSERVSIDFEVLGQRYRAGLRATQRHDKVWISPDLDNDRGEPQRLADVLAQAGLRETDEVVLDVVGKKVVLIAPPRGPRAQTLVSGEARLPLLPLAEFVCHEHNVEATRVMLLRHAGRSIESLEELRGSVEEYTSIQAIDSQYDYRRAGTEAIECVVVIVRDCVYGVFRVGAIEAVGTNRTLSKTPEYRAFEAQRPERRCRRFVLTRLPSAVDGNAVVGWARRARTPVQRFGDAFFADVRVMSETVPFTTFDRVFEARVRRALRDKREERLKRLASAPTIPPRVTIIAVGFIRNEDVVAEVLHRAGGRCESCLQIAPFKRRVDGTPYLEVHHRVPLAAGGRDSLDNAIAVCPNCHRAAHYG